jgi:ABC-type hemin transport system substrate-binding protein
MRVVSLVPSLTESVLALGVVPVACTRFCEQPTLAHVGGTKDPDIDAIVALRPDVVLVNDEENRRDDVDALVAAGITVHITHVATVGDVVPMLVTLAQLLQVQLPDHFVVDVPLPIEATGTTFIVPIWRRPWMLAGADTYGSSMLEYLGLGNACRMNRYPELDAVFLAALNADIVIAPSEPYPFTKRHHDELAALTNANGRVIYVDGQDLLWWGTRTNGALQRLARQLS